MVPQDILLATRNRGKVVELKSFLEGLRVNIHTMDEMGIRPAAETGSTFEENARIKALHCSRQTDWLVLADDSGLEVRLLGGQPGVNSARFGGAGLSDLARCQQLLKRIEGTEWEDRTARFVCVVVLAQKGRVAKIFRGTVDGIITFEPRGSSGFGYDPIFYHPPEAKTFGEMTPSEKGAVSHRARALNQVRQYLEELQL